MIQILYFLKILGYVRAEMELIKDLGLVYEETNEYILGNGVFEFDLEINHAIPTLEFGGGCNFEPKELIKLGQSLGIKTENMKIEGNTSEDLNKIITQALVKKSFDLTNEVRDRFVHSTHFKPSSNLKRLTVIN